MNVGLPVSPAPPNRRSPSQVAVLMLCSFGLYVFVWAYQVRRWCSVVLERENEHVMWKTVALIVPIFNLFMLFELGKRIEGVRWRAGLRADARPAFMGLSTFGFAILARISPPFDFAALLNIVPIGMMQADFMEAQVALQGAEAAVQRLHPAEWLVIVAGAALWSLTFVQWATPLPDGSYRPGSWFVWVVLAAIAATFAGLRRAESRLTIAGSG